MAGTLQPVQQFSDGGLKPTDLHASVAATNEVPIGANTILHFRSVTGYTVTLVNQVSVDGITPTNKIITMGANDEQFIGPIPGNYALPDGNCQFNVSVPGNVTFFAIYSCP